MTISTFRVLRSLACLVVAVLLALDRTRVTRDKTVFFKRGTKIGTGLHKGAGDSMTNRTRLTGDTPALHIHFDIKIPQGVGHLERLEHDHSGRFAAKIVFQASIIDQDVALAFFQINPGYGSLPSPGRTKYLFCHDIHS